MARAPRTSPIGVGPTTPGPATAIFPWKRKLIMIGLTFLLSVGLLAALQIMEARSLAGAFWQTASWLGTIFLMAAGLVALFACLSYFKSGPHHLTLLRLKQLTGSPGRIHRYGKLTFWFPGYAKPEEVHEECLSEVLDRAEQIFGRDVEPKKRRIIVCLERQSE